MRDILILTEADLRAAIRLEEGLLDTVASGFAALARGGVVMPPILSMAMPDVNGEVDIKMAYVPGLDGFAVKVSPGFFDNPKQGLPSLNGLMVVLDARTGLVDALLLDNGYLTDLRTAAAGGIAARLLAPAGADTLGIMGTGAQARLQAEAAALARNFRRVLVWGRDRAKAAGCAADIQRTTGIAAAAADPDVVVRESQLVVTCTPATAPILMAAWLHPGLHVTAMGSDHAAKNEIEPQALAAADLYVCDSRAQCESAGELRSAIAAGLGGRITPVELGALVIGGPGRRSESEITICDLTGTGVQDTAIAAAALNAARAAGLGQLVRA